jgi:phosphoribosyl 1,2-cyclic phosphodiesterase
MQFTVLGSGSSGNSAYVRRDSGGILLDFGFGPRMIADRLRKIGRGWVDVAAVLLTHTHADHWKETSIGALIRHQIPLYCHADHAISLQKYAKNFFDLRGAGLVNIYQANEPICVAPGVEAIPFPVCHDSGPTFGFRMELSAEAESPSWHLGYACDLGIWQPNTAEMLADADIVAIEFNHDVEMQRTSARPTYLIKRVLGKYGHLSNEQAADLLRATLKLSGSGRVQHVVQLHLSRQCNRSELAQAAAMPVLDEHAGSAELHTATQDHVTMIALGDRAEGSFAQRRVLPARQLSLWSL